MEDLEKKQGISINIIKDKDYYENKTIDKLINTYNINIKEMHDNLDEFI